MSKGNITETSLLKYSEKFTTKIWKFSDKNSGAQNIDCGYSLERRGGSNESPQVMFLSRNKKNNIYPVNPSFTI